MDISVFKARGCQLLAATAVIASWLPATQAGEEPPLACLSTVQITDNSVRDAWPDWEPGGERITFNTFSIAVNVPREIGLVNSDGSGYDADAGDVPGAPWGTFFPRWGPGNTIVSAEHNVFHEYLTFDVSKAPFTRTVNDGSDEAFTRELFIPGGGGGGWMVVSADGEAAFWRYSSSGGAGTQQIRTATLAELTGQAANAVGTSLQQVIDATNQYWVLPIAVSPDGSMYINAERTETTANTNLIIRDASDGGLVRSITNDAADGISAREADFSPDGTKIAYARIIGDGQWDIYVENLDGSGQVNVTDTPETSELSPTWDPTGTRLAFTIGVPNKDETVDEEIFVCTLNNALGDDIFADSFEEPAPL